MPSPFNNSPPVAHATGAVVESEEVTDSVLECDTCYHASADGTYWPQSKRLTWVCMGCGKENVVRNIEL